MFLILSTCHHTMASGGVSSPALLLLPLLVVLLGCGRSAADSTPQQIHLSLTDDVTAVQVTYSTLQPGPARARYGRQTPDTLVSRDVTAVQVLPAEGGGAQRTWLTYLTHLPLPGGAGFPSPSPPGGRAWPRVFASLPLPGAAPQSSPCPQARTGQRCDTIWTLPCMK